MTDPRKHPSGRPIRRQSERRLSIMRNPGEGAYLPRLRPGALKDAIGFTVDRQPIEDLDE